MTILPTWRHAQIRDQWQRELEMADKMEEYAQKMEQQYGPGWKALLKRSHNPRPLKGLIADPRKLKGNH